MDVGRPGGGIERGTFLRRWWPSVWWLIVGGRSGITSQTRSGRIGPGRRNSDGGVGSEWLGVVAPVRLCVDSCCLLLHRSHVSVLFARAVGGRSGLMPPLDPWRCPCAASHGVCQLARGLSVKFRRYDPHLALGDCGGFRLCGRFRRLLGKYLPIVSAGCLGWVDDAFCRGY